MDAKIAALRGHVVVCGHGRVGASAVEFLHAGGQSVVVVDADPARLAGLDPDILYLVGDVNDDEVLRTAGIERASAVIIALDTDAELKGRAARRSRAERQAERERVAALDEERASRPWGVRLGEVDLGAASLDDVR
ncbi:NAD(P)-binding protein, partial [Bradyrhizobium sp. NBAIM08]|uniref:NAD(P)-binding protein n=1 Tax=Bradyrhizobium sp. NBAIM08 TaxID=2793815 RepID=UPI001CD58CBF